MRECNSKKVSSVLFGQHCRKCGKSMRLSLMEPAIESPAYIYRYECDGCGSKRIAVDDVVNGSP